MIDPFLLFAPLYLLGVMALLGFVGCFIKPEFSGDASKPLVFDETPGGIRHESGWYGMTIVVGPEKLTVRALGRYFVEGNSGTHRIRIVDPADPAGPKDIALTMVNMAADRTDPDDPYVYGDLTAYATLAPGGRYHIVSEESAAGDAFHDQDTEVRVSAETDSDADIEAAVESNAPGVFVPIAGPGDRAFGPVNLRYVLELND